MKLLAIFATLLFLAPGPAAAQSSSSGGGLGGVLDTLGGILGIAGGKLHGHVVATKGDTLVVRTDGNRTVAVDASRTDPRVRGVLKPGDGVTLTMSKPREGEPRDATPQVTDLQLDPPSQATKSYQRTDGVIEEASQSKVTFRTREGMTLPLDVSTIQGLPALQPGQPATLFYEQGRQGPVAVWIEPGSALGSAPSAGPIPGPPPAGPMPGSTSTGPMPGTASPGSASPDTGVQRVQGHVDAVTTTGFTLTTNDGRRLTVDTTRIAQGAARDIRPGDNVTVFGRPTAVPEVLAAEYVQPETARR